MKKEIIKTLKELLRKNKNIKFAYLFGSFVKEEKYSDIDIGIYLYPLPENVFIVTSGLKHIISRELRKKNITSKADDIDIVLLNLISFKFLNRVFKEGILILDRDSDLRTTLIEKNAINYRECVGILKEAEIL
ncbi:MAG: nucleotidyltransferase domain-containing protein [Candidatus Aminicenantia bacterium]